MSSDRPRVDWIETISDNLLQGHRFSNTGARRNLLAVREHYPVALHGVSMSLGSTTGVDRRYLKNLKQLVTDVDPIVVSDHLCWTHASGRHTHDLNPLPYTEAMLKFLSEQISSVQDVLGRRILVENLSSYIEVSSSQMPEAEFLAELSRRADCGLLLDINNVYVSSINHGFDAIKYLSALPPERVGQIHLAGHTERNGVLIDTHDQPVRKEVWDLYRWYGQNFGHASSMIERDGNIPEWAELSRELDLVRTDFLPKPAPGESGARDSREAIELGGDELGEMESTRIEQQKWAASLLEEADRGERFQIYRNGFWGRVISAIEEDFPQFKVAVGAEEFRRLSGEAIRWRPSHSYELFELSQTFVDYLREQAHSHLELAERDWAEARALLATAKPFPAGTETRFENLQTENPEHFDRICLVLHPSLQILEAQKAVFWFDNQPRQKSFSQSDWPAIVALSSQVPLSQWEGIPGLTPANVQQWTQEGLICGYQKRADQKGIG